MDIKIFASNRIDLESKQINNSMIIPIRCGAVYDNRENISIAGDDTGDNISSRRNEYCELTVQYWAWKNVDADYYGLCHYRRFLIFPSTPLVSDPYGNVLLEKMDENSIKICGLENTKEMKKGIQGNDIIISEPYNVTYAGFHSIYEHFTESPAQHLGDLQIAVSVVKEMYPEYSEAIEKYLSGTLFYPCSLFIMRKAVFFEYCEWLFNVLGEIEKRVDTTNYNTTEKRLMGFLGERFLGVFYTYYTDKHPDAKTKIIQRALFLDTSKDEIKKMSTIEKMKKVAKRCLKSESKPYIILRRAYKKIKG